MAFIDQNRFNIDIIIVIFINAKEEEIYWQINMPSESFRFLAFPSLSINENSYKRSQEHTEKSVTEKDEIEEHHIQRKLYNWGKNSQNQKKTDQQDPHTSLSHIFGHG